MHFYFREKVLKKISESATAEIILEQYIQFQDYLFFFTILLYGAPGNATLYGQIYFSIQLTIKRMLIVGYNCWI